MPIDRGRLLEAADSVSPTDNVEESDSDQWMIASRSNRRI
jgi:hypothetical protein